MTRAEEIDRAGGVKDGSGRSEKIGFLCAYSNCEFIQENC
jgi:hypothetical protein